MYIVHLIVLAVLATTMSLCVVETGQAVLRLVRWLRARHQARQEAQR